MNPEISTDSLSALVTLMQRVEALEQQQPPKVVSSNEESYKLAYSALLDLIDIAYMCDWSHSKIVKQLHSNAYELHEKLKEALK